MRQYLLVIAYFVLASACLFTVLSSPLGGIYIEIPPLFLFLYFIATLVFLSSILFAHLPLKVGLLLVITHALVSHAYFAIQFYPGIGGDQWLHLAYERSLEKGWLTTHLLSNPWVTSLPAKLYMILRDTAQYILVITSSRILAVDIYLPHLLFIPILWNIFTPLIAFKIAQDIIGDERTSLLSSFLAGAGPSFMHWGSVSVPNSLGFFFFFFSLYCFLRCISKGTRWNFIIALISVVASSLSHYMTGFAAFSLLLVYMAVEVHRRRHDAILVVGLVATSALTIPLSVLMLKQVYPIASYFSLEKFYELDIYQMVFAGFTSMGTPELLTSGGLLFLGMIGIFRSNSKYKIQRLFMGLSLLVFVFQYRFLFYFVEAVPFSPTRLWAFRDLILVPYAAMIAIALLHASGSVLGSSPVSGCAAKKGSKYFFNSINIRFPFKKTFMSLLVLLALSSFISSGVVEYYDYLSYFIPVGRVTTVQLDAVEAIREEYLKTHENYVVISDHATLYWAAGVAGYPNPNEVYPIYEDSFFRDITGAPMECSSILARATGYAKGLFNQSYGLAYFIAVEWPIKFYTRKDFSEIVDTLSKLLETFYISLDHNIYIFKLKFPLESHTGIGPEVEVTRDGVPSNMSTIYRFETQDNVVYNLTLSGSSKYNVTGWPIYWHFKDIEPIPNTVSIDANTWINFTGSLDRTYVVRWKANEFYRDSTLWRDDSFLHNWKWYYATAGIKIGSFASDGRVANETVEGEPEYYTIFRKEIPATQNVTRLLVSLKGTENAKFLIYLFDDEGKRVFLVFATQPTSEYKQFTWSLPEASVCAYVDLAVRTLDGSPASIFWDYVALLK